MPYNFDEIIERRGTNCIKYDRLEQFCGNAEALPMWVADTDFRVPDFIMNAIRERAEHEVLAYSFRPESYHQSIIDWMKKRHDWDIQREWISFSPGVVPAVTMLIMALTNEDEKVIVQPPVYFPFFTCVKGSGRKMVENPLKLENGRYYFDFEDLKAKIDDKTKMLLLSSPHNPGGMVWTKDELAELGRICKEKGVIIVSDEIHSDLIYPGHKHVPLPSISEDLAEITVVCMAPNKTFNIAGLSSAFLVIPQKKMRVRYERILNVLHVHGGNIFGTVATEAAYTNGEEWLGELLEYLQGNLKYLNDFMAEHLPKVKVMQPESTFLVWMDFRDYGLSEKEMKDVLVNKAGVAMNVGSTFGTGGEGFFRMNIGCPRSTLEEGLERIEKALRVL
ncbi:MalY/PatB family protein [Prolixibacter denitrificans]|uniref:cysteine-S-conjugate beta-lyase n=1 Tax=Prolixibacter denitrificans TaxID=1541063 RepID=A0A2P8CLD2_9BACT|nr:PatB family C-S lyase [Prolixibacter denitrificans]PSK85767.1 cystathionine beta-lyase [Prolixibacter denitrificans]GET20387.1 aminotransferase [Prolixibacter denitrificans]